MRITKIIIAILFILFAALQWNDPDPWLWISVYLLVALLVIADILGRDVQRLYRISIIALAVFSLFYIPGVIDYFSAGNPGEIVESMKAEKPYIEETREFGGLLIVIGALLFLYIKNRDKPRRS